MRIYKYKAMNSYGSEEEDEITAESIKHAAELIKEQGLFPISINETNEESVPNIKRNSESIKDIQTSQYRQGTTQKRNVYIVVFCILLCIIPMTFIIDNGRIFFASGVFLLAFIAIIIYIFNMLKTGKYSYMTVGHELKESSFHESPFGFVFWILCNLFLAAISLMVAIALYMSTIKG